MLKQLVKEIGNVVPGSLTERKLIQYVALSEYQTMEKKSVLKHTEVISNDTLQYL